MRALFFLIAAAALLAPCPALAGDTEILRDWIAKGRDIRSFSADFVQTRTLRTLRMPLKSEGHVWFQAPRQFRWELGSPPRAAALRIGDDAWLIDLKKKRAKKFDLEAAGDDAMMRNFLVLEFPIARSYEEFTRRFEILATDSGDGWAAVELVPREPEMREMVQRATFVFEPASGDLMRFDLTFRDGSRLRNEFSNVCTNVRIDPAVFTFDPAGFRVQAE